MAQHNEKQVGNYAYNWDSEIGSGSYALVFKGRHIEDGSVVAIKRVNFARLKKKLRENLQREIEILKDMRHPNIVQLYDATETKDYMFLVMELCEGGDLSGYIAKNRPIPEPQIRTFSQHIAAAMLQLFNHNIIHRDLKPQNILLMYVDGILTAKLADFGFARYLNPEVDLAATLCGSPIYMAPEILEHKPYGRKADLWSIGTVLYECAVGRPPFRASNYIELSRVIKKTWSVLPMPEDYSAEFQDLLRKLLVPNPDDRIGDDDFFHHPFLDFKKYQSSLNLEDNLPCIEALSIGHTSSPSPNAPELLPQLHPSQEEEQLFILQQQQRPHAQEPQQLQLQDKQPNPKQETQRIQYNHPVEPPLLHSPLSLPTLSLSERRQLPADRPGEPVYIPRPRRASWVNSVGTDQSSPLVPFRNDFPASLPTPNTIPQGRCPSRSSDVCTDPPQGDVHTLSISPLGVTSQSLGRRQSLQLLLTQQPLWSPSNPEMVGASVTSIQSASGQGKGTLIPRQGPHQQQHEIGTTSRGIEVHDYSRNPSLTDIYRGAPVNVYSEDGMQAYVPSNPTRPTPVPSLTKAGLRSSSGLNTHVPFQYGESPSSLESPSSFPSFTPYSYGQMAFPSPSQSQSSQFGGSFLSLTSSGNGRYGFGSQIGGVIMTRPFKRTGRTLSGSEGSRDDGVSESYVIIDKDNTEANAFADEVTQNRVTSLTTVGLQDNRHLPSISPMFSLAGAFSVATRYTPARLLSRTGGRANYYDPSLPSSGSLDEELLNKKMTALRHQAQAIVKLGRRCVDEGGQNVTHLGCALALYVRALKGFKGAMAMAINTVPRGYPVSPDLHHSIQRVRESYNEALDKAEAIKAAVMCQVDLKDLPRPSAEMMMFSAAMRLNREGAGHEAIGLHERAQRCYHNALLLLLSLHSPEADPDDLIVIDQ
eukprot:Ihof_evm18s22 gene=Ihof_evmTU18s22